LELLEDELWTYLVLKEALPFVQDYMHLDVDEKWLAFRKKF
jgi:hypothetical protein